MIYKHTDFESRRKPEIPEKTCESEHGSSNHLHIKPLAPPGIEPGPHWCKARKLPLRHTLSPTKVLYSVGFFFLP